ncbi:hypothetical protein [Candidatus Tisiphia endosymbiont of Nemotelus uliginosus]|uniref:hypothetical protein n=1 Tax=Candidatus Tisiphia endosymbiont of Nemotelus uliginosus TaxID=3077926 RepID=UPI0035C9291B
MKSVFNKANIIEISQKIESPHCLMVTQLTGEFNKNNFQEFWRYVNNKQYTTVILPTAAYESLIKYYQEFNNCMQENNRTSGYSIKFKNFLPETAKAIMSHLQQQAVTIGQQGTIIPLDTDLQLQDNLATLTVECSLTGKFANLTQEG